MVSILGAKGWWHRQYKFFNHIKRLRAAKGRAALLDPQKLLGESIANLWINLLTAFFAAVVRLFEHALERVVLLVAFLPALARQSGNTGCQALAVALRGIPLGEVDQGDSRRLVIKKGLLDLLNGIWAVLSAALGMYISARFQANPNALTLRRLGADPATAPSIFLITATNVVSMGISPGLTTLIVDSLELASFPCRFKYCSCGKADKPPYELRLTVRNFLPCLKTISPKITSICPLLMAEPMRLSRPKQCSGSRLLKNAVRKSARSQHRL